MEDLKDKIAPDMKERIESQVKKVEEAIQANNLDAMKSSMETLTKTWNEISQNLYQQQGAGQQAPPQDAPGGQRPTGEPQGEKPVEDASYEVVDDQK